MFKWIDDFLKPYQVPKSDEYSLAGLCAQLAKEVVKLEERITKLEEENVETTNALYEIENRLQAKIDNIHPVTYHLKNYTLDK
jgi:predicted  nucleic acid-binding Zn-ribbon protein